MMLKTIGVGLALVGTGYVAYKALGKLAGFGGDSPLAVAVQDAAEAPLSPGKTGYRNPDGTYQKVRTKRDPNRDK